MATHKTYDPDHITKETFQSLLVRYPSTVESTTRRKATTTTTTTTKKKSAASSSSSSSRPKSKSASKDHTSTLTVTEDPDDAPAALKTYLALDEFRYKTLPDAVRQRASTTTGDDGGGDAYLEKEELVRLVEWKMKHGKFRPALLGMIRSNPDSLVREATGEAFRLLRNAGLREIFPGPALEKVTGPLRGVGPATGSLVLSVLSSVLSSDGEVDGVPFYSDDVFLWLCLGVFPGGDPERVGKAFKPGKSGELNVKYNVGEYHELWDAVRRLKGRLGVGVECLEIEKVAFVVRFGIGEENGMEGVVVEEEEKGKKEGFDLQDIRGKRKRGKIEEEEEEQEEKVEREQKVGVRRSTRRRGGK